MLPTVEQVHRLAGACERFRDAKAPTGYPTGLALCVVDSIQSTGVTYTSVENVVARYREFRRSRDRDAFTDGAPELAGTFVEIGGPDAWAERIGNRNKVSTRTGAPLKAVAIELAAHTLIEQSVATTHDLRLAVEDPARLGEIRASWLRIPGQRSGITWHYLQMLAGIQGVKPDRMIIRFVADSLNLPRRRVTSQFALAAVLSAADEMKMCPTDLDHGIWQWQRRRN
ncbi:hypothetical protein [Nocardia sp. NPDC048505]|uniref:hypothetical protein n=1 Tax=unclassified Nocardia TaxID=2637762 RepID=UPI0033E5B2DB